MFPDGVEFSATDTKAEPILTINAPIGLNFRDNPAYIQVQQSSLTVSPGESLTLVGGNVSLDGVKIFSPASRVELGGLSEAGTVSLNGNLSLSFPDQIAKADVVLDSDVAINVIYSDRGSITINAGNVELLNNSLLIAGIEDNAGSPDAQAGNIVINATDRITLNGNSFIQNQVGSNGQGNAGNVQIEASSITLNNRSSIGAQTFGQGDSGDVTINAEDSITINSGSSVRSLVRVNGEGDAGDIVINTGVLNAETIEGTSEVKSLIFSNTRGVGNAGNVNINATDSVTFDNSSVLAQVDEGASGNGGNVTINTPRLEIKNSASQVIASGIFSDTKGTGNAGDINITTEDALTVERRSSIGAGTTNKGNAGDINITTDLLSLSNFALLTTNLRKNASGDAGTITIDANNVEIFEGASIDTSIINVSRATDFIGGEININAQTLDLMSGGKVSTTTTNSNGNAGNLNLTIADRINIDGSNPKVLPLEFSEFEDPLLELESITGLLAINRLGATGNGGNINIISPNASINISNGEAQISVSSQGQGSGGSISIEAQDLTLDNNALISASTVSGEGGNITFETDNILLRNNSLISARALKNADGGNINIDTDFIVAFPNQNNDIIANAQQGNGGNIKINAQSIFGLKERLLNPLTNDINASSELGLNGNIDINTPDVDPFQETREAPENVVEQDEVVAGVCGANQAAQDIMAGTTNSFVVNGKGGVPPEPTQPFGAETLLINGQSVIPNGETEKKALQSQYPPIMTDQGPIYPARGIVKKPDGSIYLTAYPTNDSQRNLINSKNCSVSGK